LGTFIFGKVRTATEILDMGTKMFVGNLSFDVTENDLQDLFAEAGTVTSVNLMQDRTTGKPRGFGFVEMASEADMTKAISMFNGKEFKGRALTVNEARPREERSGGGGGGYRDGGGRRGGGGGYRGGR
jgi:RNA recognition motif-containing protein